MANTANEVLNVEGQGEAVANKTVYELACVDGIGTVQIAPGVIASIVKDTTLSVEGVVRLAPSGLVEGLADVFSKRTYERSIVIEFDESAVSVSLVVVLKFGCRIPEVAAALKAQVKSAIEEQVGASVKAVNIVVKDLEKVVEEPAAEDEVAEQEPANE